METQTNTSRQNGTGAIASAIIVAGAFIAIAIYIVAGGTTVKIGTNNAATIPPVTAADHILGNPKAQIIVVEYSDLDCPYCRTFNATMKQIMSTYGADGRVAWVYRHFPIVELHPNAPKLAEASECVAKLGGNAAFWKFIDGIFTAPSPNDHFDMNTLGSIAALSGVSASAFDDCLKSGQFKSLVDGEFKDATAAGAKGTPHNIIINTLSGQSVPVAGAQPYATIQSIIETMLPH